MPFRDENVNRVIRYYIECYLKKLLINDTIVSDEKIIAESLNDFFTILMISAEIIKIVKKSLKEVYNNLGCDPNSHQHCPGIRFYFSDIKVMLPCVYKINLKASKATGMDNIPAKRVLKAASRIIAPLLTVIFRQSLSTGIYLNDWNLARVSPIYKSEDRKKCENYRPISILPIIPKCLLRYINI
jgi:hypothetical protein